MTFRNVSDLVRQCFLAWENRDRQTLDSLLADDFTFSSPNGDDHISKAQYFEKCWPGGERIKGYQILNLMADGNEVFARYECELKDGTRFRNTEFFRIRDYQIVEVDVYFGRTIT